MSFRSKVKISAVSFVLVLVQLSSCTGRDARKDVRTDSSEVEKSATVKKSNADKAQNDSADISTPENQAKPMPTVIDFYATWCGPCKNIAPLFEVLRGEYSDRINFCSVDVDQQIEMAEKYTIDAMPTFVFLDTDGNEIERVVGADPQKLTDAVDRLANNPEKE